MKIKKVLLRFFFAIEVVFFSWVYFYGDNGFGQLSIMEEKNQVLEKCNILIEDDVAKLEDDIYDWENNSFYREKIAREKLQMAYPGEQIYYVK